MYVQSEAILVLSFFGFITLICWLAISLLPRDPVASRSVETTESGEGNRAAPLDSLVVGDVVIITGKAAGDFDRIVRPVTGADRNYLWVDGHRYSRIDGRQTDVPWFEIEHSRIEVEPEWLE
jgi:prepilin-type processing-associated H-X9-DG protein